MRLKIFLPCLIVSLFAKVSFAQSPDGSSGGMAAAFPFLLVFCGVLIGGAVLLYNYFPQGKKCRHCGTALVRVPDSEEGPHLEVSQRFEQAIGSVDYKVWRCPKCHKAEATEHNKVLSKYKECPKCGNRTVMVSEYAAEAAAYSNIDIVQTTRKCTWTDCDYEEISQRSVDRSRDDYSGSDWD